MFETQGRNLVKPGGDRRGASWSHQQLEEAGRAGAVCAGSGGDVFRALGVTH